MPEEKTAPAPAPAPAKAEDRKKPEKATKEEKEEPKAPRAPKKLEGVKEDFRYIVRMANTDLDGTRSVTYALTAIPGVGIRGAESLGKLGEVPPHWLVNRPKDWETGLDMHVFGSVVEIRLRDDINRMRMIRSYKGVRHEQGQKVRGQRTRSNGRTGLTVGVIKKTAIAAAKAKEEEGGKKEEKKE